MRAGAKRQVRATWAVKVKDLRAVEGRGVAICNPDTDRDVGASGNLHTVQSDILSRRAHDGEYRSVPTQCLVYRGYGQAGIRLDGCELLRVPE
jgi:hypothetical protein